MARPKKTPKRQQTISNYRIATGSSNEEAKKTIALVFAAVADALAVDGSVDINNFGTFTLKRLNHKTCINNKEYTLDLNKVGFKPFEALKRVIN